MGTFPLVFPHQNSFDVLVYGISQKTIKTRKLMNILTSTTDWRKLWCLGCAMVLLCFQPGISHAALLAPGSSITAPAESDPTGGSLSLLDSISSPFSTTSFNGTLISSVYSNDTSNPFGLGDLTFTYELILTNGPDSASAVSIGSFAGFHTDVSYQIPSSIGPGFSPASVSRGPTGSQAVKFDFTGNGYLPPGTNSALLVVQTDAGAWVFGNATVLDSNGSPNVQALTPTAVPEPACVALIAFGLSAVAGYRRWKR
jgi:hypothetical protein